MNTMASASVSDSHCRSCSGWEFDQVATMANPAHAIQISGNHRASTGERQWRVAVQGRVAAGFVVVSADVSELSFQIAAIPEQHVVEEFSAHGANQALHEGVG